MTPSSQTMVTEERQNDLAVERVLRQAQISRLTQNLRSRLQLATLKTQGHSPQALSSAAGLQAAMSPPLDPDSRFSLPATPQSIARQRPSLSPSPVKRGASLAAGATFEVSGTTGPSGAAVAAAAAARRPKDAATLPLRKRARTLEVQNEGRNSMPAPMAIPHSISTPTIPQASVPIPTSTVPPSIQAALASSGVPTPPASATRARQLHSSREAPRMPNHFSPQSDNVPFIAHERSATPIVDPRKEVEPRTPPPQQAGRSVGHHLRPTQAQAPKTPGRNTQDSDGANLLLYLATSPGRPGMAPRTPHTPRTPDFNLNDYLHLYSPSPKATPGRDNRLANLGRINQLNQDIFAGMGRGSTSQGS